MSYEHVYRGFAGDMGLPASSTAPIPLPAEVEYEASPPTHTHSAADAENLRAELNAGATLVLRPAEKITVVDPGVEAHVRTGLTLDRAGLTVRYFGHRYRCTLPGMPRRRGIPQAAAIVYLHLRFHSGLPAFEGNRIVVVTDSEGRCVARLNDSDRGGAFDDTNRLEGSGIWEFRADALEAFAAAGGLRFDTERYETMTDLMKVHQDWEPEDVQFMYRHQQGEAAREAALVVGLAFVVAGVLFVPAGGIFQFAAPGANWIVFGLLAAASAVTAWARSRYRLRRRWHKVA